MIKASGITTAAAVALVGTGYGGVEFLDTRYATAQSMEQLSVDIWYGQYFDRLDDLQESEAEGNEELAELYREQIARLLAKICAVEPAFKPCKDD